MKTRIISALIALIIVIPIIIYGKAPFYLGAAVIGLIGFLEMLKLIDNKTKIPYVMKTLSVCLFTVLMMNNWDVLGSLYIADSGLFTSIIFLLIIPIVFYHKSKKYNIEEALMLIGCILFLGVSFNQLVNIRMADLYLFIFVILIPIISDTFAYFVGKLIGKHKMCPSVSPKKTWEGFVGGLLFSAFVCTVFYVTAFDYTGSLINIILAVMVLSVMGQLGDLVFSSIKRHYKIKDFGNIMPGHGGVLDRLDSILFVILAFSYVVKFL